MKRLLDIIVSTVGLVILSPLLLMACFFVWLQDRHSPFYIAARVGFGDRPYRMIKLRSMVIRADGNKVDSTANDDPRITVVGHIIRRAKFDEIPQLWNVLVGDMSLVGPRPNVRRETDLYTLEEKRLLTVRPGITDISSIVFADEGAILAGSSDPDLDYNRLIRPWKSRLGLLYIEKRTLRLDCEILVLTAISAFDRPRVLARLSRLVTGLGASEELASIVGRAAGLHPAPPPGAAEVVRSRSV